jgi:hypothetical protein
MLLTDENIECFDFKNEKLMKIFFIHTHTKLGRGRERFDEVC